LAWVCGAACLTACAALRTAQHDFPPDGPYDEIPQGQSELYAFNASGWTLVPSKYAVHDNGNQVADLERGTYRRVPVAAGVHELKAADGTVQVNMLERHRYYFVVEYSPGKSWALPFAGSPMFVGFVPKDKGRALLAESKEVQGP